MNALSFYKIIENPEFGNRLLEQNNFPCKKDCTFATPKGGLRRQGTKSLKSN